MSSVSAAGFGHLPALADQLRSVATLAQRASTLAVGDYLPNMSRADELTASFNHARFVSTQLEDLQPRIAMLDGGEDGLRLAKRALEHLESGRTALKEGVAFEDDVLRSGGVVASPTATGTASHEFAEAHDAVSGIADMAQLEATSGDDLLRALLG